MTEMDEFLRTGTLLRADSGHWILIEEMLPPQDVEVVVYGRITRPTGADFTGAIEARLTASGWVVSDGDTFTVTPFKWTTKDGMTKVSPADQPWVKLGYDRAEIRFPGHANAT